MRSAIFLDKDGVLVNDDGFPQVIPRDTVLIDGTVAGLRALQSAGYALVIVSNQGWIATGKMTVPEADDIFRSVREQYAAHGVTFDAHYYCPHGKREQCACRKPNTGMLERAVAEHGLCKEGSFMVGDMPTDILLARRFNLGAVLVRKPAEPYAGPQPDYDVPSVNTFARMLLGRI